MTNLHAGLAIPRRGPTDVLSAIKRAEERGVPTAWSTVGATSPDTVTLYAAAAVQTSRITLGTSITPTYPRHPATLASQALALEGLAPGRVRIGIGTSHRPSMEGMLGIPMGKPLDQLREYLTVLRDLLWTGKTDFKGDYFTVKMQYPAGTTPPKTPLPIAALRANAFHLAGEVADGAISWVTPVQYLVNTALPALRSGAESAGRAMPPLIAHVPVAVTTDREAARNAFRDQFSTYGQLPFYANMFRDAGYPVGPDGSMSDDLVDNLAVSGDADEIAKRLAAIHAEGIDELLISHVVVNDADAEERELAGVLAG